MRGDRGNLSVGHERRLLATEARVFRGNLRRKRITRRAGVRQVRGNGRGCKGRQERSLLRAKLGISCHGLGRDSCRRRRDFLVSLYRSLLPGKPWILGGDLGRQRATRRVQRREPRGHGRGLIGVGQERGPLRAKLPILRRERPAGRNSRPAGPVAAMPHRSTGMNLICLTDRKRDECHGP